MGSTNTVNLPSWEVLLGHLCADLPCVTVGSWCLLPQGIQYLQEVGSRASGMFKDTDIFYVFHLFQVVSVPFAVLRTFGGVSNCAIAGFGGYLINLAAHGFAILKLQEITSYYL